MNPFAYSKTAINLALQNIQNSELPQTKDFLLKPINDNIGTPSTVTMLSDDSDVHFTSKVLETKRINAGQFTSYFKIKPHDFLLSLDCYIYHVNIIYLFWPY